MPYRSFEELQERFLQRRAEVHPKLGEAVERATLTVFNRSQVLLNELIYSAPIDQYEYSHRYRVIRTYSSGYKRILWTFHQRKTPSIRNPEADVVLERRRWRQTETGAERARRRGEQGGRQAGKGRAKWLRTGLLRRAERWSVDHDQLVGMVFNLAEYALPRHDLGLPAGHRHAFLGSRRESRRIAPWRKLAEEWWKPQALSHFANAVRDIFKDD